MGKKQIYYLLALPLFAAAAFFGITKYFNEKSGGDTFTTVQMLVDPASSSTPQSPHELLHRTETRRPAKRAVTSEQPSAPSLAIEKDDQLNQPDSEEDVDWLNRNGYPSMAAFENGSRNFLDAEDFDGSTNLSAVGMVKAEIFASTFPGRADSSVQYLERAAKSGSVYALEALSRFYANELNGNPTISAAYLRAAELRGNWALSSHGPELSGEQRYLSNLYAQRILADIDRDRASEGRAPLGRALRPGLEDFLDRVEAAQLEGNNGE